MTEYKEMIIEWVDTEYSHSPSNTDTQEEYENIMKHIDEITKNVYKKIQYVNNLEKEIDKWK